MGSHPDTELRRLGQGVQGVVTVVLGDVLLEGRARWVVGLGLISPYIRPPVDELILCFVLNLKQFTTSIKTTCHGSFWHKGQKAERAHKGRNRFLTVAWC